MFGYYEQDYSRALSTRLLFILGRYHHLKTSPLLSSLSTTATLMHETVYV